MLLLDLAVCISYQVRQRTSDITNIIFDISMSNFAGAPTRQLQHPDYVPNKFSHAIKSYHKLDKQFKRIERHLKGNATSSVSCSKIDCSVG